MKTFIPVLIAGYIIHSFLDVYYEKIKTNPIMFMVSFIIIIILYFIFCEFKIYGDSTSNISSSPSYLSHNALLQQTNTTLHEATHCIVFLKAINDFGVNFHNYTVNKHTNTFYFKDTEQAIMLWCRIIVLVATPTLHSLNLNENLTFNHNSKDEADLESDLRIYIYHYINDNIYFIFNSPSSTSEMIHNRQTLDNLRDKIIENLKPFIKINYDLIKEIAEEINLKNSLNLEDLKPFMSKIKGNLPKFECSTRF